jgi:hypothetical protein
MLRGVPTGRSTRSNSIHAARGPSRHSGWRTRRLPFYNQQSTEEYTYHGECRKYLSWLLIHDTEGDGQSEWDDNGFMMR